MSKENLKFNKESQKEYYDEKIKIAVSHDGGLVKHFFKKNKTDPLDLIREDAEDELIRIKKYEQELLDLKNIEQEIDRELEQKLLVRNANIAYGAVRDYVHKLNIEIDDTVLTSEKVSILNMESKFAGCYSTDTDIISSKHIDIQTLIHEILHFATAIGKISEVSVPHTNRISKIGFHSNWDKENINKPNTDIFRSLNEAVTEKMAKQIYSLKKDEIENKLMDDSNNPFSEKQEIFWQQRSPAWNLLNIKHQQIFEGQAITGDKKIDEIYFEKSKKLQESFENYKNQSMQSDGFAYIDEIHILEAILYKMAVFRSKEEGITEMGAGLLEWDELQRAYLKGDTLYLKRIEKIVGRGILREFDALDRRDTLNNTQTKEQFNNQVYIILEHIQNPNN